MARELHQTRLLEGDVSAADQLAVPTVVSTAVSVSSSGLRRGQYQY